MAPLSKTRENTAVNYGCRFFEGFARQREKKEEGRDRDRATEMRRTVGHLPLRTLLTRKAIFY